MFFADLPINIDIYQADFLINLLNINNLKATIKYN